MEKQNCCGRPLPACSEFFGDQKGEKGEPETFAALKAPRQRRRQGEGQNGWLVPGEKRGVTEERGIRRKDVFEGCTARVSDVCRRWRETEPAVSLCWLRSLCHLVVRVVLPDHIIVLLAFGPS